MTAASVPGEVAAYYRASVARARKAKHDRRQKWPKGARVFIAEDLGPINDCIYPILNWTEAGDYARMEWKGMGRVGHRMRDKAIIDWYKQVYAELVP